LSSQNLETIHDIGKILDGISAVGLACNIAQFISWGSTIFNKASEIRKSSDGALKENLDIETTTKTLESTLSRIEAAQSSDSPELNELRRGFVEVINELPAALGYLKPIRYAFILINPA
jgi:hypothetical protein